MSDTSARAEASRANDMQPSLTRNLRITPQGVSPLRG
jgi:hypothetical protein